MHYDPQDLKYEFQTSMIIGDHMTDRFPCDVCGKSYLRKRHLQRHRRDECIGIPPRFSCDMCPSRFRRKYHMVRHLTSKHSVPVEIAQQTTGQRTATHNNNNGKQQPQRHSLANSGALLTSGGGSSYNGGDCNASIGSGGSHNGCDSPIPENLSLRKYSYENSPMATGSAEGNQSPIPPGLMPTYGLTGAITAITAAAALVEESAAAAAAAAAGSATNARQHNGGAGDDDGDVDDDEDDNGENGASNAKGEMAVGVSGELIKVKREPVSPAKSSAAAAAAAAAAMDDDWKMKLSLQLISSSLLKERLMNTMPFAYNNN